MSEPGNQTPNTPDVSETELRESTVAELRQEAKEAGVSGTSGMRKEELVQEVVRARTGGSDGADDSSDDTADDTADNSADTAEGSAEDTAEGSAEETAEGTAGDTQDETAAGGADEAGTEDVGAGPDDGRVRTGEQTSRSLEYSQEVTSPDDEPERPGRSLVTTHHEVIKRWAEERGGTPATVEGTEHGELLGVLRFDFGNENANLREVSWEEWFRTFDERRLNFIYQEQTSDGTQSNFFRLESPDREDG